ncbi:MAG: hypothetical protein FJ123_00700 [Deltaproteobacteria bacterium]|nr:hypothetical protein [Deltaproteobacteria bacterium]
MKCKKCNSEVSIADSKCPQCGSDLLQFGATTFYDPKEREKDRYGKRIKDGVLGDLGKEVKEAIEGFDPQELEILQPVERRLRNLFLRSLSDPECENAFDNEILPIIEALSRDRAAEKIFKKVEETIKDNLGPFVFNHYQNREEGKILKILRAGEITFFLIKGNAQNIDLSVKMFPFFKASEVACRLHTHKRYEKLRRDSTLSSMIDWMGDDPGNIFIRAIPDWLTSKMGALLETVSAIFNGNEKKFGGCLRTGISICIFGREWIMRIERKDKVKEFQIKNILKAKSTNENKVELAKDLNDLQDLRNERVHRGIEEDEKTVQRSRMLSYNCLKKIPQILEI